MRIGLVVICKNREKPLEQITNRSDTDLSQKLGMMIT